MKKKIVFVMPTLQGGGAEKVVSNIVLKLNKKKYDVEIIVFDLTGQKYLKNKNIKIHNLKCKRISQGVFSFMRAVNQLNPNVLISSISHLNLFISILSIFLPSRILLIARESNFLSKNIKFQSIPILMKILYKIFYNNFDCVLVFSKKHKIDIIKNTNINEKKINIIENPLDIELINKLSNQKIIKKYKKLFKNKFIKFVFVGSLSFQKGLDIFIKSLVLIKNKKFIFNIIGSGSEKTNLKKLIKENKLNKQINLIPYQNNPFPYIKNSDVFIMSSRFEGLSNTVLETLSLNKPIIFLNNIGVSTDILKKAKNSYIINSNNPTFISKKIINYKIPNKKLSNANILKRFEINNVIKKYEKLLDDLF